MTWRKKMKKVKIKPQTTYNPDAEPAADGWLQAEFLKYGGTGKVIEKLDNMPDLGDKSILRIVKVPGSDIHHFPENLGEVGQRIANHQYQASAAAHDKLCLLTYRVRALAENKALLADEWHAHAFPKTHHKLMTSIAFFNAITSLKTISPKIFTASFEMFLNEYLLTDIEPTFYQSEKADADLNVTREKRGLIPHNTAAIPETRAPENGLIFITSQVFHRAPSPQDISPVNLGKKRSFLDVMYVPTKAAEKLIQDMK
jgi:hypothetical protein